MKGSPPPQRKTPMPRGQKRLSVRSKTNSKPNEDLMLRWKYAATHPTCLLCGNTTEQVHHVRRGCRRVDSLGNLAALCFGCHMVDGHGKEDAVLTIRCLFAKVKLREFCEADWNEIGTPYLAGCWPVTNSLRAKSRPCVSGC